MTEERKPTVRELWDAARIGMIWRNKPIDDRLDKFSSARLWLKEEDLTQGVIAVKATAIYDNYMKWCKERSINKSKLSMKDFSSFLKDHFRSANYHNSQHYFINKELAEDSEAKKIRKEKYTTRKNKKTEG